MIAFWKGVHSGWWHTQAEGLGCHAIGQRWGYIEYISGVLGWTLLQRLDLSGFGKEGRAI